MRRRARRRTRSLLCRRRSASAARARAGSPCRARKSGVPARWAVPSRPRRRPRRPRRTSSSVRAGEPGMVAATPTRRPVTSNRSTGWNAGPPASRPSARARHAPAERAQHGRCRSAPRHPDRAGGHGGGHREPVSAFSSWRTSTAPVTVDIRARASSSRSSGRRSAVRAGGRARPAPGSRSPSAMSVRRAVAVGGEHAPGRRRGLVQRPRQLPAVARRTGRSATAAKNSPTVMPGQLLRLVVVELTPKRSSTRTASSASDSDSRSAPAGPERGVVVDVLDAVVHLGQRVEQELANFLVVVSFINGAFPSRVPARPGRSRHRSRLVPHAAPGSRRSRPRRRQRSLRAARPGRGRACRWRCAAAVPRHAARAAV